MTLTKIALRPTWLKRWAQKSFAQDFTFLIVQDPSSPSSVCELNLMACLKTQKMFLVLLISLMVNLGKVKATPRWKTLNPWSPDVRLLILCVFKLPPAIASVTCTSPLLPVYQHTFSHNKQTLICLQEVLYLQSLPVEKLRKSGLQWISWLYNQVHL